MDKKPSTHSSYQEIIKQVYDNPSNYNLVKLLDEAGIEKNKLNSIVMNNFVDENDIAYVMKFIKISSANMDLS